MTASRSRLLTPRPRCAGSTKTSQSQAKVARSVTTRANPACLPPRAGSPSNAEKQSECSRPRSKTSRGRPSDQYASSRRNRYTRSRSTCVVSLETTYGTPTVSRSTAREPAPRSFSDRPGRWRARRATEAAEHTEAQLQRTESALLRGKRREHPVVAGVRVGPRGTREDGRELGWIVDVLELGMRPGLRAVPIRREEVDPVADARRRVPDVHPDAVAEVAEDAEGEEVERAVMEGSRAHELERLTAVVGDLLRGALRPDLCERILRDVGLSREQREVRVLRVVPGPVVVRRASFHLALRAAEEPVHELREPGSQRILFGGGPRGRALEQERRVDRAHELTALDDPGPARLRAARDDLRKAHRGGHACPLVEEPGP